MSRRTTLAQQFARDIVDDPEYRANLKARAVRGTLAPAVENTLLFYAYGKPADTVNINQDTPLEKLDRLTNEQLEARAKDIVLAIQAQKRKEAEAAAEERRRRENAPEPDLSLVPPEPLPLDENVLPFRPKVH